jgi:hypothetical protein
MFLMILLPLRQNKDIFYKFDTSLTVAHLLLGCGAHVTERDWSDALT